MTNVAPFSQDRPVVVGVDGSRNHLATVDLGVTEAVRREAPLRIVHVWPGRYSGQLRSPYPVPTMADGEHLLQVAARRAAHVAPQLDIGIELVGGSASAVLVQRTADSRLLVVGHRDEVPARPSWGSTASYLAHHSVCPLLVHRGATAEAGPVVLAASARAAGAATVATAFEEARLSGSRLVAIHVWAHSDGQNDSSPQARAVTSRQQADRALADALAAWTAAYPDVVVERVVLHDLDVAYTLDRASRRGRLLVAGRGPDGRFAELLYGSMSLSRTRQTACPVLLVPSDWQSQQPAEIDRRAAVDPR